MIRFCPPLVEDDDIQAVTDVLRSGWLSTGEKAHEFEEKFKRYVGAEHALALNSCTAALHLALLGSGIGPGDEVIVPDMTFCATANVVENAGAKAVFADCKYDFNIDPERFEEQITPRTKAIIPVHFGGRPCEMNKIQMIAEQNDLIVIEDCAHAIGSKYRGKRIGSSGNLCAFSFYATKNVTTCGEGGMLVGSDEKMIDKLRMLSLHGMSKNAHNRFSLKGNSEYDVCYSGWKYNMPDVSAAMGISQLKKIGRFIDIRRRYASYLYKRLKCINDLALPDKPTNEMWNSWHLFPLFVAGASSIKREYVLNRLKERGIGCGIHYKALHQHSYYKKKYGLKDSEYPVASFLGKQTFSIPFSHSMTFLELQQVVDALEEIFE